MPNDQLKGYVERITYQNPDNYYTIAKLKCSASDQTIPIIGTLGNISVGQELACQGKWKHEAKYGKQFHVQSYTVEPPKTTDGIEKYLSSGIIKGIGPKIAQKIVGHFGISTLDVIQNKPSRLKEVEGLGQKKILSIKKNIEAHKAIESTMVFLRSHQISPAYAKKIYKQYGDDCVDLIQKNPYTLARNIAGIGFKLADKIAFALKIDSESFERISSGIEYTLEELSSEGHVCCPIDQLIDKAKEILSVDASKIEIAIKTLFEEKRIFIDPEKMIYLKSLFLYECGIVQEVDRLLKNPCALRAVDTAKALTWSEEKLKIKYAKEQKLAIASSLENKLQIITGGPGTGKSTITKAIIYISEKLSKKVILAAPTGRAAKRMQQITYRRASTIHSLLEYDFANGGFKRGPKNPIDADLIIIDEASMIDTRLMYALLRAVSSTARLIFIGDIDQLPSVGPGNVLRDLIDSEKIKTSILKFIFRQGKGSKISYNAYLINGGYFPKLTSEKDDDFFFFDKQEPLDVLSEIIDLTANKVPKKYGFDPIRDIQVLAPMRKGVIGVENINFSLQKALNHSKDFVPSFNRRFFVSDKVMQIKNNYKREVFNGDLGIIETINHEEEFIEVDYDKKLIQYVF